MSRALALLLLCMAVHCHAFLAPKSVQGRFSSLIKHPLQFGAPLQQKWMEECNSGPLSRRAMRRFVLRCAGSDTAQATAKQDRDDIRNLAIVAHVDHGKTTLVDAILRQSAAFRENQHIAERVMDSNDQERERGITILAKNTAVRYKDVKINIVDTPGHADFGGEVERIVNMVDGVLLLVDAVDGPKPQTRFVLKKALERGLRAVVVVNKVDREHATPEAALDKVFDLFVELGATDQQMEFQTIYASGLRAISGTDPKNLQPNLIPLFDAILKLPKPTIGDTTSLQLLVANIAYNDFKGKLGIGRIHSGEIRAGTTVAVGKPGGQLRQAKINEVFVFENLDRAPVDCATAGEIVMFSGVDDISIGETVTDAAKPELLAPIAVAEPTVKITLGVNTSPLAGRDGKQLTSRVIRDRLFKELDRNVALRVTETASADTFEVAGRGQLHLTVLIEAMRREGFEMLIGPPTVITAVVDGVTCEPFETVEIQVPEEHMGVVIETMAKRKGDVKTVKHLSDGRVEINAIMPTRGLVGMRGVLLTGTRGTVMMDSAFLRYQPMVGAIDSRDKGSLLAYEAGTSTAYGLMHAQERGQLFVQPRTEVYKDMIVGINRRPGDLAVNVCKLKQLTNMRSATKGPTETLEGTVELTLDSAMEYIQPDELVEVTPNFIRALKNPSMKRK